MTKFHDMLQREIAQEKAMNGVGGITPAVPVSNAPATCGIPKDSLPTVCAPKVDRASFSDGGLILAVLMHDKDHKKKDCDLAILIGISVQQVHAAVELNPTLLQMQGSMVAMVGAPPAA